MNRRPHPLPYPVIGCAYSVAIGLVSIVVAVTNLPKLFRPPPVDSQLLELVLSMWLDDYDDEP